MKLTQVEKNVAEMMNERSMELFGKQYELLGIAEIMKLDQYNHDLAYPIWKDIVINGTKTNYEVSNTGMVRNKVSNHMMSFMINEFGYQVVKLRCSGLTFTRKVHRLVATAFIPNPDNKREVNHINTKKTLNWVGNLEWNTSKENKQHAIQHGLYDNASFTKLGTDRPGTVYSEETVHKVCKLLEEGKRPKEVADLLGVDANLPRCIKYAGKWKHIASQYKIPETGEVSRYDPNKKYPSAKLSEEQVHQVCKLMEEGKSNKEVAKITGISASTLSPIRLGKRWTFISGKYNIPKSEDSFGDASKHRDEIIVMLKNGNVDYGNILNTIGVPDTRFNRKYIGLLKFKLKKRCSTTIGQLS